MTLDEIRAVVEQIEFRDYVFLVEEDGRGAWYLRGAYQEPDIYSGIGETQLTRRWFVTPSMCKSELVQTVFKCCLTSMEHRTREFFRYRGHAVYGPHFDVDALWRLCEEGALDWRGKMEARPLKEDAE